MLLKNINKHPVVFILIIPACILLLHSLFYWPFIADDALISFRYSERLVDGFGLTWTEGVPVEGYSNLLWVLLIALFYKLGFSSIAAAQVLGTLCILSIFAANAYLWYKQESSNTRLLFVSQLMLACSAAMAVWAVGGLEQALFSATLAWAYVFLCKYIENTANVKLLIFSALTFCLACLTRPDAPLFVALAVFIMVYVMGFTKKGIISGLLLTVIPASVYLLQIAWRYNYYGELFPNTALIKVNPSLLIFAMGALYVSTGLLFNSPLVYFSGKALFNKQSYQAYPARVLLFSIPPIVWLLYLVYVGGDFFPAYRHLLIVVVLLAFALPLLAYAKNTKVNFESNTWLRNCVGAFLILQFLSPMSWIAKLERFEWDSKYLSDDLVAAFAEKDPVFAVSAAGTYPYFTKFKSIDMLGLNDYHIARNPPKASPEKDRYAFVIGHNFGDPDYVLKQKPDLIDLCHPGWPKHDVCFIPGEQLFKMPEFRDNYLAIQFKSSVVDKFNDVLWVYKYSDKIGIDVRKKHVSIPAYFIEHSDDATPTVSLDMHHKQFSADLSAEKSYKIVNSQLAGLTIKRLEAQPSGRELGFTHEGGMLQIQADHTQSVTAVILHLN